MEEEGLTGSETANRKGGLWKKGHWEGCGSLEERDRVELKGAESKVGDTDYKGR